MAPFYVMEVVKAATRRQATHGDLILACVGQPSTPAPRAALEAASAAMAAGPLGYTDAVGTLACRTAIAQMYGRTYGLEVDPEDVVVTTGSSGGFLLTLLAGFEAGDTVAMTVPGYPAYRNDIHALSCEVVELHAGPETRYQPTVEMLESLPTKPRGLIVASPANPTGTIIDPAVLAELVAWCEVNDCLLISDEIYHGITFGRPCHSAWESGRSAVVVGSVSKYWSMTGWRLGWLLMPQALRRRVELLQGNLAICAPAISQAAAVGALAAESGPELDAHVARYAANREVVMRRLPEIGVTELAPLDGAFYAYCDVAHLTQDSLAWCGQVLDATGVALAPGIDFDPAAGHRKVRISLSGTTADLEEAFDRIGAWLGR